MNEGQWNHLRYRDDRSPPQQLPGRDPGAEETVEQIRGDEGDCEYAQKIRINVVRRVELVGEVKLDRCIEAGIKPPQKADQHCRVNGAMLHQTPHVSAQI